LADIEPLKDIYKKVLFNLNKACAIEPGQKP
jgi:hypothetical protein